jgi:hypothetical protein
MYTLPYQTKICSIYPQANLDKLHREVSRAALTLPFPQVKTPASYLLKNCYFVTPLPEHEDIPMFTQFVDIGTRDEPKLLIDGRQYFKYEPRSGTYRLTANNDWSFQCIRMALNSRVLKGDEAMFSRFGDIPAKVFSRWVSGPLVTKFGLSIESQMALFVIGAYYYYAMCMPELQDANPESRQQFAPVVSRITGVPPDFVINTILEVGPLRNADDLAEAMSTKSYQERTGRLKFQDVYLLLSSSWFGTNARENVGVALEHPPTFIAMLYMAVGDRSYRKTVLSQRAETVARPHELKSFTDLVFRQVSEQYENFN